MQFNHVTLAFDGPVAILTLDHQEVMNAVSIDMLGGLAEALDAIDDNKAEVRCLVLTGAGRRRRCRHWQSSHRRGQSGRAWRPSPL